MNVIESTRPVVNSETQVEAVRAGGSGGIKGPTICQRIRNAYRNAIKKFVEFLNKHKWYVAAMVLGTLLLEPWQAIKAGFRCPAGWKKHFNFYKMNPKVLTEEQLKKRPILLIHGNYHNQSGWMNLAKSLKNRNLGPVYTVNVPNGDVTSRDYEIIQRKVEQIKAQYKKHNVNGIKIDVIGHSRGGYLAHRIAWTTLKEDGKRYWKRSEDIGKVIKIGSVLDQDEINAIEEVDSDFSSRVYEIVGKYDILETQPSLRPRTHKVIVNSGHLGLLYSAKTHRCIIKCLT